MLGGNSQIWGACLNACDEAEFSTALAMQEGQAALGASAYAELPCMTGPKPVQGPRARLASITHEPATGTAFPPRPLAIEPFSSSRCARPWSGRVAVPTTLPLHLVEDPEDRQAADAGLFRVAARPEAPTTPAVAPGPRSTRLQ